MLTKMKNAFTLTELLVSISIILILSGLLLLNYQTGDKTRDLIDASYLILQEARKAQNLAFDKAKMLTECGGSIPKSFSIYFSALESSNSKVDIFGDKNNDDSYNLSGDICNCTETNECLERQILPSNIKINQIKIGQSETICNTGWVNFLLSDFSTQIKFSGCTPSDTSKIKIEICVSSNCQNNRKSIIINNKGMVEIQ